MIYYVTPSEEELFMVRLLTSMILLNHTNNPQRYNPELQRRSLENRKEKQEDFDRFVNKLKDYSKSDKPSKSL